MKKRNEIDEKYKWDLSPLCKSEEEFLSALKAMEDYINQVRKFEGKLNNKKRISSYLTLNKEFEEKLEPIFLYCALKCDEDLGNSEEQQKDELLSMAYQKLAEETAFVSSELHELSDKLLDSIIKDKDFKDYSRSFEAIKREKIHMLSKKEEKLLSGMSFLGGFSGNSRLFSDADLTFNDITDGKGKKHKLDHSSYADYIRSNDRTLRKNAMKEYNGAFGRSINMLANNYINYVKEDCYFAKIRKYKSALNEALEDEEVSKEVYDRLLDEVNKNLDILFKYFELKKKCLNLKDMYIYDNMADIQAKSDKKYTFEEAMDIVYKALSPLGEDYVALLKQAVEERWLDVFPSQGKRTGAYENAVYGIHPYVLLNFNGSIGSVFEIAHELGHAMHTVFASNAQPRQKAGYTIFLAEIASTTNEILLLNYLLNNAKTNEEKIALYNKFFDEVKGSIYRQTMFAEFEAKVHEAYENNKPLSKDFVCQIYYDLNKKYFGKVKLIDEIKYEWARVGHFFSSFYVYKYATGMICAMSFAGRILKGEEGALDDYKYFLSAGDSEKPLQVLNKANCPLESGQPFEEGFNYLRSLLAQWQKCMKK